MGCPSSTCLEKRGNPNVADPEHLENQVHPGHALEPEHLKHLDHPEGVEDLKNCWDLEGLLWCGASTRLVNTPFGCQATRAFPFDKKRSKASRQGVVTI